MKNTKLTKVLAIVLAAALVCGIGVFAADKIANAIDKPTVEFNATTKLFTINTTTVTHNDDHSQNEVTTNADGKTTTGDQNIYPVLFEMDNMMPGDSQTMDITVKVSHIPSGNTVKLYLGGENRDNAVAQKNETQTAVTTTAAPQTSATTSGDSTSAATTTTTYNPYNDDYGKLTSGTTPATLTATVDGQNYNGTFSPTADEAKLEATDNSTAIIADSVYLGEYTSSSKDKTITVTFKLPLAAGNEYQNLAAKLGWVFYAQIIPQGGGGGGGGPQPTEIPEEPVPKAELDTTNHYAYIIGMPDGLVHPEQNITRGEVATIFFRMLTDDSRTAFWQTTNTYKDVPSTMWCNNAISTLTNAGILKGYEDGTFRPNASISRAEFATMAVRFFESQYNGADKFSDIASNWARQYINAAAEAGIIKGYTDGTFRPNKMITRAEAVTIMNRVLLRAPDKDHLLADMKVWPDNKVLTKWYYADMQEATNSHDFEMPEDETLDYEIWTKMQPVRDWAAFEKQWSTANSAANPGEIISSATSNTATSGS
jgi:hypothetical protein